MSYKEQQPRVLYKSKNKKLVGVCAGLAEYFEIDPLIVRLVFLFAFLIWGVGPIIYLILAVLLPSESEVKNNYNESQEGRYDDEVD